MAQTQSPVTPQSGTPGTDESESAVASPGANPRARRPRRRLGSFASIQSKLLLMLLLSTILAASVVGFASYRTGTDSLREEAQERLLELRSERSRALQKFFEDARAAAVIDSRVATAPMRAFDAAYQELTSGEVSAEQQATLRAYYEDEFVPELQETAEGDVQADSFIPTSPARSYLQATYTAAEGDFDAKLDLDDAGDGSTWSAVNAQYQPFFRQVVLGTDVEDVMLVNLDGEVVYTAYKGTDLGSNILTGEYAGGALEQVFDAAKRSNSLDFTTLSDMEPYQPSFNQATQFLASPIVANNDELIGIYVIQISVDGVNTAMTGDPDPTRVAGLGESGETVAYGPDALMRSISRLLVEDPQEYEERVTEQGTPADVAARQLALASSVILQELPTAQSAADTGDGQGVITTTDYLGTEVLASYGPADVEGLDWYVVSKISTEEAYAPVRDFARTVLLSTAAIVLLVCVASLLMARVFTVPLNRLLTGVRRVAGGELGVQVAAGSRDEFGDLATAFNDMSTSLHTKQRLLEEQQAENQRLLLAQMPETVARRYREGETTISGEHQNVSVVYTEVEGFDDFVDARPAAEALELLNTLSRGFDDAAARTGTDKVRSVGTGYVASSGLVTERVDHARRVVDFALDVAAMVERFNNQHGSRLTLRAGIHSGDARSGLVGRSDVVYNLWGEAVNLAYRIRSSGEPGIYLTQTVKDRLGTAHYTFVDVGPLERPTGPVPVWRLIPEEQ